MNNRRVNRISSEIKRVISQLLLDDSLKDPRLDDMISITDVDVTNDLAYANVYISVLGGEKERQDALDGFDNAQGYIKKELGRRLELRHIPELNFKIDESLDQGQRIEELIKKIHKENPYE